MAARRSASLLASYGGLGLALLARNDERHRHPVILDHLVADLLGGPLAHAKNVLGAGLLQCRKVAAAIMPVEVLFQWHPR